MSWSAPNVLDLDLMQRIADGDYGALRQAVAEAYRKMQSPAALPEPTLQGRLPDAATEQSEAEAAQAADPFDPR